MLPRLGLTVADLEDAERSGLIAFDDGRSAFRHPLVGAAAYHTVDSSTRRRIHAALAAALEGSSDERRAWHLAESVLGVDDEAAAALERAAHSAAARGAPAVASRAFERAARLSSSRDAAATRLEQAAVNAEAAGRSAHASALLDEAIGLLDDQAGVGLVERRLHLALDFEPDRVRARALWALERTDEPAERVSLLEAAARATLYLRDRSANAYVEAAAEERRRAGLVPAAVDVIQHATVLVRSGRIAEGVAMWETVAPEPSSDYFALVSMAEVELRLRGDPGRPLVVLEQALAGAERRGAVGELSGLHSLLATCAVHAGQWRTGALHEYAAMELARACGQTYRGILAAATGAILAALRGDAEALQSLLGAIPESTRVEFAKHEARAVCELVHRRFSEAATHAATVQNDPNGVLAVVTGTNDGLLCEALVRAGRGADARRWLAATSDLAAAWPNPIPRGERLRVTGILAADDAFDEPFEAALELHDRGYDTHWLAHTRLCYGERLRRAGRRREARRQLRPALATFERLGSAPWVAWARDELAATGERPRRRDPSTLDDLTPHELTVAAAVASGLTNREAAERLFVSEKAIEKHLSSTYRKLDVQNRTQLARRLAEDPALLATIRA
jgi:DNA-binding CsgD family transcriptional regulator